MFKFTDREVFDVMEPVDSILLEAVEQAHFVFCYHARLNDVTFADVCHPVVQVSGAADQAVEDAFL